MNLFYVFFHYQRRDYSHLTKLLPAKYEYVIAVRLSAIQIKLYETYLEQEKSGGGNGNGNKGAGLFTDYQALMRIWTHPWVLKLDEIRQEKKVRGVIHGALHVILGVVGKGTYCQISNISFTKCQNFNVSGLFFVQSIEARCQVEHEDVVGAAQTGDAPTTSEWPTILLPTKVPLNIRDLTITLVCKQWRNISCINPSFVHLIIQCQMSALWQHLMPKLFFILLPTSDHLRQW